LPGGSRFLQRYARKEPTHSYNTRRGRLGKLVMQGWAFFFPRELV